MPKLSRSLWCVVGLAASTTVGLSSPLCKPPYVLGLEALKADVIKSLGAMRVGLVTNQTGRDMRGRRTVDLLRERGLNISCILVPEHGFDGTVPAEREVPDSRDAKTGLAILGLHSKMSGSPIKERISGIVDVFVVDLQEVGMRHFTYISTLYSILAWAERHKKMVVVLDRPNPLGDVMEGPLVEPSLTSFISIAPIPLRHGMTLGELALYFNTRCLTKPAKLRVVAMENYNRAQGLCGKFLAPFSHRITSLQACYGYSFLGLLGEIRPFHTGFCLERPFQAIMLPCQGPSVGERWQLLAATLGGYGIASKHCSAYDTKRKISRSGLLITIDDITKVPAFRVLLAIIDHARSSGVSLELSPSSDKALGTRKLRAYLAGTLSYHDLAAAINKDLTKFLREAQACFLYKPHPRIVPL